MSTADTAETTVIGSSSQQADFLPFTRPSITAEDIDAVVQVLESGWITTGAKVRELEQALSELTGNDHCIAVTSATAGMHLVLHALGIGPGDEVITPSMTWVSTVNIIELCGATPRFVDVNRDTLMVEADAIEQAISDRTKLIVPVHYAGAPLDLAPIARLAAKHGIPMVEDAAHALGASYRDRAVGNAGTAVFSLQAIKNVTTAEGGAICTNDDELAAKLRRCRFHGLAADSWARRSQGRAANAEVEEPGFKYNLPDMNAALGLGQLRRLNAIVKQRTALAQRYRAGFDGSESIRPLTLPAYAHKHAWHLFVIRLEIDRVNIDRDGLMNLLKQRGIGSGVHFRAVHTHKYYANRYPETSGTLPATEWNSERLVTLPLFADMQLTDVDRVVHAVDEIASEHML